MLALEAIGDLLPEFRDFRIGLKVRSPDHEILRQSIAAAGEGQADGQGAGGDDAGNALQFHCLLLLTSPFAGDSR